MLAVGADDRDHVGQVELLLRVVGPQPAQRRAQRRDVEGVHAGVDLANGLLRRRGVGLLDDADDLTVLGAQDAAVTGRIGQRRGQHGRGGRLGAVRGDQVGQRVGVQQRDVARGHDDDAGEVVGQGRRAPQPTAWPVPSCSSCTAMSMGGPARRPARRPRRATRLPVMAEHDDQVLRRDLGDRVQRVRQHAAARPACAAPWGCRTACGCRPRPPAPGPRSLTVIDFPSLRTACRDVRVWYYRHAARQSRLHRSLAIVLRRQDSNLNYLNQNQRCCRLHHDGLINS